MVAAQAIGVLGGGVKKQFFHQFRYPWLSFKGGGSGVVVLLDVDSGVLLLGRRQLKVITFQILGCHNCSP